MKSPDFVNGNRSMQGEHDSEFNLFELAATIAEHARGIFYTVSVIVGLTAVGLMLMPNKYTSTASILPTGTPDQLQDLKSLVGLEASIRTDESSSELFPSILKSRLIEDAVLANEYTFHVNGQLMTLTLRQYFEENEVDRLYSSLAGIASFRVDKRTGVIHLSVETKHPAFSQILLAKYISELEHYNLYYRRSRARESEVYLARQLGTTKNKLLAVEDELEQFQSENRNWSTSTNPMIIKELLRLNREVEIRSSMYLFLTTEYERTKIEAQKDVPIVQLLDKPSLPSEKSGPFRARILIMITLVTFLMVVFMTVVLELLKQYSVGKGKEPFERIKRNLQGTFPFFSKSLLK